MAIGAKLDTLLKHEKMKVSKLSRLTGIPAQTIYAIIRRDSSNVDLDILQKICKVMKISISYFYDDHKSVHATGLITKESDRVKFSTIDLFGAGVNEKYYNIATNNTVLSILEQMAAEKNCKPTDIIEQILTTHVKDYVDMKEAEDGLNNASQDDNSISVSIPVILDDILPENEE